MTITANGREYGTLFNTYGAEHEHVKAIAANHNSKVWTLIEVDGKSFIESGYHYVNRLGYFITEIGFSEKGISQLTVEVNSEEEFMD
ncbi:hypothetical protein [Methylomonas sp. AM2-LC]|uniref:hypothetical protein n=1 Tax=Methylomonas sp. AM2-LC TaxID=3153301 RepID=UPI003267FD0E